MITRGRDPRRRKRLARDPAGSHPDRFSGGNAPCDAGWSRDDSLFHNANCALPDNAYLGQLVVASVLVAVDVAVASHVWRTTRSTVRRLAQGTIVVPVLMWAMMLAQLLQSGAFEAYFALFGVAGLLSSICTYDGTRMFLLPLAMTPGAQASLERRIRAVCVGLAVMWGGGAFACAAVSRSADQVHNAVLVASQVSLSCGGMLTCVYMRRVLGQLLKHIDAVTNASLGTESKDKLNSARTRLEKSRSAFLHLGFSFAWATPPFLLQAGLGSLPFAWIVQFVSLGSYYVLLPRTLLSITSEAKSSDRLRRSMWLRGSVVKLAARPTPSS